MSDLETRREALAALALPEGGWGYAPGQTTHLEPTCLALLALAPQRDRHSAVVERGLEALRKHAGPDGAYRLTQGREEAVWPTALVLFVQTVLGRPAAEVQQTASRLLATQGRTLEKSEAAAIQDIDVTIVGWPWAEGNFSWVEPTAWACLALRRAGYGQHPRVAEGQKLLLDRIFPNGGINYGNRMMFDKSTEPFPGPTAIMLLALQGPDHREAVRGSVDWLRRQAAESTDVEHLGWSRLALDCHAEQPGVREDLPILDDRLRAAERERTEATWLRPAVVRQALACLALAASDGNPFRLPESTAEATPTILPISPLKGKIPRLIHSLFGGAAQDHPFSERDEAG